MRFSLKTLTVAVLMLSVGLATLAWLRQPSEALRRIYAKRGYVVLDHPSHLASALKLRRLATVTTVHIESDSFGDEDLRYIAQLEGLEELDIKSNGITDEGVQHLAGCESLFNLTVVSDEITGEGLRWVDEHNGLRNLRVWGDSVTGHFLKGDSFPLTRLSLSGRNVGDEVADSLPGMRSLRELSLARTNVSGHTLEAVETLPPRLQRVVVSFSRVTDEDVARFKTCHPGVIVINNQEE